MRTRVNNYISWKRGLSYAQKIEAGELLRFAKYADEINYNGPLTTKLALDWAKLADKNTRLYQARRIEIVRCFAKYEAVFEPLTEIPPRYLFLPVMERKKL